ncbi:cytochrome P450 [Polyporus arcularius HHB13444]|uniref:Cytochrome P450 n=1 Tax=Polyporus arcularius HHB13444 TaxID=1314778 RepID=A0A5C3P2Q7_9APHY|nr:cytochrome P450 [Polyporus arcularius HHB13444]
MSIPFYLGISALVSVGALALGFLPQFFRKSPIANLPGPPAGSVLFGNVPQVMDPRTAGEFTASLCETYGPVHQIHGALGERLLHVFDPRALHSILVADMEHFPKELAPINALRFLLGPGMLGSEGLQHRRQRKLLNSAFSQAHLRNMIPMMYEVGDKLRGAMAEHVKTKAEELDVNAWMAKTSLDILGHAFLGYSFDSFVEDSRDSLGESIKSFFAVFGKVSLVAFLVPSLSHFLPESLIRMLFRVFPFSANLHRLLDISDTMRRRATEIVQVKKAALNKGDEELLRRVGEGKDIMSLLLKSNMIAAENDKISDDEVIAQVSTIMLAGLDTTSNALSHILHVLAQNTTAQEQVRAELLAAQRPSVVERSISRIPHDELMRLPYVDAVFRETLRLYPPVGFMSRRAAKDIVLPLTWPVRGKDGSMMHEVIIPKGTLVVPNLQACNRNKALWGDDAHEWRPERWMGELPRELYEAHIPGIYSNLMTFSGGGRSCIGVKFAELETKIVLSILLTAFKFELTDKPVVWNFSVVDYPTMGESSTKPELLLKVSPLLAAPATDKDSPVPLNDSSSDTPVTPHSFIDKGIGGSKTTMRVHHGAVDQTMVTTGSSSTVMRHVKAVLEGMGVEVIIEGDYKYRCTRPKRTHVGLDDPGASDAFTPPHQAPSSTEPEAGSDAVRVAAAVPGSTPGSISPIGVAAIYGVAQQDVGDEVRFAVEVTRLAQLDGTYSLDVRRLKGNLRSYTFLYDTFRQRVDLQR